MSRVLTGTAFVAAALAFLLPFGLVTSCSGGEVEFTGAQLATFSVPAPDENDKTLRDNLEDDASPFALTALVAALVGGALALVGRRGVGVCSALGLIAMQLLLYGVTVASDGGDLYVGFGLALGAFVVAGLTCFVESIRSRRRSQRSVWPTIGYAVAVVAPPLGALVAGGVALLARIVLAPGCGGAAAGELARVE